MPRKRFLKIAENKKEGVSKFRSEAVSRHQSFCPESGENPEIGRAPSLGGHFLSTVMKLSCSQDGVLVQMAGGGELGASVSPDFQDLEPIWRQTQACSRAPISSCAAEPQISRDFSSKSTMRISSKLPGCW